MLALLMTVAVTEPPSFTEVVSPYLPLAGVLGGAALVGLFARWNGRRGAIESKTPTVKEIWEEQRKQAAELVEVRATAAAAEKKAHAAEGKSDTFQKALVGMREAFLSYVDRVQRGGSFELTFAEHQALELPVTNADEDDLAGS